MGEVKVQKDLENRAIQRKTQEQNGIPSSGGISESLANKITVADSKRPADKGDEEEVRKIRDLEEKIREGVTETNKSEVISSTSLSAEELERLEEEERQILEMERKIEQRRKEEEKLQADFLKQQKEQEMIKENHRAEHELN